METRRGIYTKFGRNIYVYHSCVTRYREERRSKTCSAEHLALTELTQPIPSRNKTMSIFIVLKRKKKNCLKIIVRTLYPKEKKTNKQTILECNIFDQNRFYSVRLRMGVPSLTFYIRDSTVATTRPRGTTISLNGSPD